jgi:hypothetical protein
MVKTEERVLSIEELLSNIHSSKEILIKHKNRETAKEDRAVNKLKHMSNNLPFGMIALIILFAALGTMVITLKAEVTDLGSLKGQIAAGDSNFKIAIIEGKLEASEKEKETLKKELVQIKNTLEALRNTRPERKRLAQR